MKIVLFSIFALVSCGKPEKGEPGPEGPPGATGAQGPTGATGADGATLAITSKLFCNKQQSGLSLTYYNAVFANGTRFVTCTIADGSASYQSTVLYAANQDGNANAGCAVSYDSENPATSGFWSFTLSPRQAKYTDVGSSINNAVITFTDADCTP